MEPDIREAQEELDKYGIKSVAFNTDKKDTVCHVIGHKQIYANMNSSTNGGNDNANYGVNKNISEYGLERGFSWDDSSGLRSDDYMDSVWSHSGGSSRSFWNTLSSDGANNTDCIIALMRLEIEEVYSEEVKK